MHYEMVRTAKDVGSSEKLSEYFTVSIKKSMEYLINIHVITTVYSITCVKITRRFKKMAYHKLITFYKVALMASGLTPDAA